jgi:hypothetical protein
MGPEPPRYFCKLYALIGRCCRLHKYVSRTMRQIADTKFAFKSVLSPMDLLTVRAQSRQRKYL